MVKAYAAASVGTSAAAVAARKAVSPTGTGYAYHADCLKHVHGTEQAERMLYIQDELAGTGLAQELTEVAFLDDPLTHVERVHTADHIDSIDALANTGLASKLAVSGILGAIKMVSDGDIRNAFCAIRPPGHHAHNSGYEEGFCFYSNIAVAARYAQDVLGYEKILIIDWDYHHGNGTQDVFYDDPSVLFSSTHDFYAYPGTGDELLTGEGAGEGYNINIHCECATTNDEMLQKWDERLLPKVEQFEPDFVLISSGFDSKRNDLLGCFDVTAKGFSLLTKKAMEIADTYCDGRLVSMLEGGYADRNTGNTFCGIAACARHHIQTLLTGDVPDEHPYYGAGNMACDATPASYRQRSAPAQITIKNGLLYLPESMGKAMSVSVNNVLGKTVYRVAPSRLRANPVDLRNNRLASGRYFVHVDTGRKAETLPYLAVR
ncbi:MAG: histone deacetylase [Chitinivibrionales bacterium]|nr:histone deacetylase [Chitinivibrionales bacterium]